MSLLLILSNRSPAAEIEVYQAQLAGGAKNRDIVVNTRTGRPIGFGTNTFSGPVTYHSTNGLTHISIRPPGTYALQIDGITATYYMIVPDSTNTYNVLDLINAGMSLDSPQPAFATGTNCVITTNYVAGQPVYTFNFSGEGGSLDTTNTALYGATTNLDGGFVGIFTGTGAGLSNVLSGGLLSTNGVFSGGISSNFYLTAFDPDPTRIGRYTMVYTNGFNVNSGTNWAVWRHTTISTYFFNLNDPTVYGNYSGSPVWSLGPSNDVGQAYVAATTTKFPATFWEDSLGSPLEGSVFGFFSNSIPATLAAAPSIPYSFVTAPNYGLVFVNSATGDDLNNGYTATTAFRTVGRALQLGYTNVVVAEGYYLERLALPAGAKITGAGMGRTFFQNPVQAGAGIFSVTNENVLQDFTVVDQIGGGTIHAGHYATMRRVQGGRAGTVDVWTGGAVQGTLNFEECVWSHTYDSLNFQTGIGGTFNIINCVQYANGANDGTTPVHGFRVGQTNAVWNIIGGTLVMTNGVATADGGNYVFGFNNFGGGVTGSSNVTVNVSGLLVDVRNIPDCNIIYNPYTAGRNTVNGDILLWNTNGIRTVFFGSTNSTSGVELRGGFYSGDGRGVTNTGLAKLISAGTNATVVATATANGETNYSIGGPTTANFNTMIPLVTATAGFNTTGRASGSSNFYGAHLSGTNGSAPTVAANNAANTVVANTISIASGSTDTRGRITFGLGGTVTASTCLFTNFFASAFSTAPENVTLSKRSGSVNMLDRIFVTNVTTAKFEVWSCVTSPTANTTNEIGYWVVE